jgi:hypothetical protein
MRYWFDTEFIEDGKTIDLISIGIVAEDGREYYAVLRDFNRVKFFQNPWLVEHVAPSLPIVKVDPKLPLSYANYDEVYTDPSWKRRDEVRTEVVAFCDPEQHGKPEVWAYYADYDWVALCQLFGRMLDLPQGWPMYCRDIKQEADRLQAWIRWFNSAPDYKLLLPKQESGEHNALADARWNRQAWEFLESQGAPPK